MFASFFKRASEEDIEAQQPLNPSSHLNQVEKIIGHHDEIHKLISKQEELYQCIQLIKNAQQVKIAQIKRKNRSIITMKNLLILMVDFGYGYLCFDFVPRLLNRLNLRNKWENEIFHDINGNRLTCEETEVPYLRSCGSHINYDFCREINDEHCSTSGEIFVIFEMLVIFLAFSAVLMLFYRQIMMNNNFFKPDPINYDHLMLDEILSQAELTRIHNIANKYSLTISNGLTIWCVLSLFNQCAEKEESKLIAALDVMKCAHVLYQIHHSANHPPLPLELVTYIAEMTIDYSIFENKKEEDQNKSLNDMDQMALNDLNAERRGVDSNAEAQMNDENSKYLSFQSNLALAQKFFKRPKVDHTVDYNQSFCESKIYQLLK